MILRTIIFFLVVFYQVMLEAQKLPRKADLGIDWVNDEKGVKVVTVYNDHIGKTMGLQPGDIITEYGAIKVAHMGALMYWFEKTETGESVRITVERNNKTHYLKGAQTPKPYEDDVAYDSFKMKGGKIRTLINRPKGVDKAPAILFMQDYTCHSIDMAGRDYYPIKKIAEDFASKGYVFIRVENMGLGDAQTDLHCYEIGYRQEGRVFCEAMNYIEGLDFVDRDRITIVAHGFGGNQVLQTIKCGHPVNIIFWGLYRHFTNEACLPMRHSSYWEEVKVTEDLETWTVLDSRIIFLHPEFDEFDYKGRDARSLQEFLQPREAKEVVYEEFPDASHFFQKVNSMENPDMTLGSYLNPEFLKVHYHEGIVPYMVEWIEGGE